MSDKITILLFWTLVLGACAWWGVGEIKSSIHNSEIEKHRVAQEAQSSQRLRAAIQRYGAIGDWGDKLKNSPGFSVQVEDALIPANGAPIAISGLLDDVSRHDGRYCLNLHDWGSTDISFSIDCDASVAQQLMSKDNSFQTINLIAKITSVEKARLALRPSGNEAEETASVEIDTPTSFLAHGQCVEIIEDSQ